MADDLLKCLHCGHEYKSPPIGKAEIKERVCPECKSNSVRKLPARA